MEPVLIYSLLQPVAVNLEVQTPVVAVVADITQVVALHKAATAALVLS
jgi:hypothetical protein